MTSIFNNTILQSRCNHENNGSEARKEQPIIHHHKHHGGVHGSHSHHGGLHGAKHQFSHRAKEKLSMKAAEKFVSKVLPRLAKRGGKRLGARIVFTKLGRGLAIAVPAIGGIFAAVITRVDYKRYKTEQSLGNVTATRAFGVAAVFDVVDCIAHIWTALGLSGIITAISEHTLHETVHFSETLSVISAVIATASAIYGEFTSLPPTAQELAEIAAEASETPLEENSEVTGVNQSTASEAPVKSDAQTKL
jgi:hypothetical protein